MVVSIGQKKELYAYTISEQDRNLVQRTGKIQSANVEDRFLRSLYVLRKAFQEVKQLFEQGKLTENTVIIELSNVTIIKWFDSCKVPDQYVDDFAQLKNLINQIPMRYTFYYEQQPRAMAYVRDWRVQKETLGGIDELLSMGD